MIPVTESNVEESVATAKALTVAKFSPAASLAEAMNRVMGECGYVQKSGHMQGTARYSYAREADFIAAIRPPMVKHGVTFAQVGFELVASESYQTKSGTTMNRLLGKFSFRFSHTGSKETIDVTALGEGSDSGDKAANKAMTAAMKYALRQTFVIETGDDPDDTPSTEVERAPAAKAPATNGQHKAAAPAGPITAEQLAAKFAHARTQAEFNTVNDLGHGRKWTDAELAIINPAYNRALDRLWPNQVPAGAR